MLSVLCAKQWDLRYAELLNRFKVLSLGDRRIYLSLCTVYINMVVNELVYFPHDVIVPRTTTLRSSSKFLFFYFLFLRNKFVSSGYWQ